LTVLRATAAARFVADAKVHPHGHPLEPLGDRLRAWIDFARPHFLGVFVELGDRDAVGVDIQPHPSNRLLHDRLPCLRLWPRFSPESKLTRAKRTGCRSLHVVRAELRRSRSEAREPPSPNFSRLRDEEHRNALGPACAGSSETTS